MKYAWVSAAQMNINRKQLCINNIVRACAKNLGRFEKFPLDKRMNVCECRDVQLS